MKEIVQLGKLTVEISISDQSVTYKFIGDVDENFKQDELPRKKKDRIIFDLANLNTFNSIGIREWIHVVKDFSILGQLEFLECSVAMIDQINMVPDCAGNAIIKSFQAPYYCASCGELLRSINIKDHAQSLRNKEAPEFKCEQHNCLLEFDALEESYFLFIDNNRIIKDAS